MTKKSLHSFFKKSVAVLILLILSVFLGSPIAYAENEKLRVYYSEPIGAGEKVYHLTACNWVRAYAPLVCSDETKSISTKQCLNSKNEVKKGTKIMGCTNKEGDENNKYVDDAKLYLNAKEGEYDSSQCKDEPERQDYKYGPVWAIVDHMEKDGMPADAYKWIMKGTVATKDANPKPSDGIIKEIYKDGDENNAYPYYKTNFCATWDLIPDKDPSTTNQDDITAKQFTAAKNAMGEYDLMAISGDLINKGCNNDNSKEALPINENGVPKPLVHCSLVERITGDTGTDIFSQYVGALYKWAVGIVGIVTVLIMVASGIQISMAGGDSAKIDSAKNRIMQSIIGLVILFLAGLILYTINPGFFTG